MWDYTLQHDVLSMNNKPNSLKCQEVYTTSTDQQQTSAAESGSAAIHVQVMTEL